MSRFVKPWSEHDDKQLMEAIASGLSIETAGRMIHRSKGSAIGRFNRLKQGMGVQAA